MVEREILARTALFAGLDEDALVDIARRMTVRHFVAHDVICRQHEPGESLFVVLDGLADVTVADPSSGTSTADGSSYHVARLRAGDVIGEMSLITGEPRSATVVASLPTDALEIDREGFAGILTRYPPVLANLNAILSRRLTRTNLQQVRERQRGEAVGLLFGRGTARDLVPEIIAAARAASARSITMLDLNAGGPDDEGPNGYPLARALATLDDLLSRHGTVILPAALDDPRLALLTAQMDRVLVLGGEDEVRQALAGARNPLNTGGATGESPVPELALLAAPSGYPTGSDGATQSAETVGRMPVVRRPAPPYTTDVAWLGRHLARTKLGLALGAGGARGYAHVGAIQVLTEAGYTVDYVGGSSMGAVIGAWLALGMNGGELEASMRRAFDEEMVEALFSLSLAGTSTGLPALTRLFQETTKGCTFADLAIPFVAMAVDLNARRSAPIREGPLWEALLAAFALAGLFPPYVRGNQRLVDGLALVPVPTGAVRDLGADIVVSVNIMNKDTLPAWPGEPPPEPPERKTRTRMLDTLLEVMDLSQLESSVRHAAQADVVLSPRFGPSSWRDFHLADRFLAAGRECAREHLPQIRTLAVPQTSASYRWK